MIEACVFENTLESVAKLFPARDQSANKGDFGSAIVIGGCRNYLGAPQYAEDGAGKTLTALCEAAMLSGAGRTFLCVPDCIERYVSASVKCGGIWGFRSKNGCLGFSKFDLNKFDFKHAAFALGMGGGEADFSRYIDYILFATSCNFVLDADGLKAAPKVMDFEDRAVLTPHPGEFARMLAGEGGFGFGQTDLRADMSISEIVDNAAECAIEYARLKHATVILKGAVSYISDGERTAVNRTGNVRLAKGGSGDVLSGIICGLLAWGLSPFDAARAGAFILGRCAELSSVNEYSHMPADTLALIPTVIDEILTTAK